MRALQAAKKQRRGDQRHERERHLADDQCIGEAQPAAAGGEERLELQRADNPHATREAPGRYRTRRR